MDGGLIVSTDQVALFAALGLAVDPAIGDLLTIDTRDRLVKSVERTWSGELVALWRVAVVAS